MQQQSASSRAFLAALSVHTRVLALGCGPLLCVTAMWLGGCGSDQEGYTSDAVSTGGGEAGFGAKCHTDSDCAKGLVCIDGDFAPDPFCSLPCDEAKTYCTEAQTGGVQGLCIALPADFQGTTKQFCAPICQATTDCKTLDGMWAGCKKPTWKNTPLYPELPTKICLSEATHGQIVVDPVTCEWEKYVTDPKYTAAKQVCKAYCTFLTTCKFWNLKKEVRDCCHWRCFQKMTPGGVVDDKVEDETKCFTKAFSSVQNTNKVCDPTFYSEQCQPIGDPHAP